MIKLDNVQDFYSSQGAMIGAYILMVIQVINISFF